MKKIIGTSLVNEEGIRRIFIVEIYRENEYLHMIRSLNIIKKCMAN